MPLILTEEQEMLRDAARGYLTEHAPIAQLRRLRDADDPDGFDRATWGQMADMGWTGVLVPEAHGGVTLAGEGLVDLSIVAEEVGRLVSPGPLLPTNVVAAAIAARGTPEQQQALLPGIVSGDVVAAWALHDSGSRWRAEVSKRERFSAIRVIDWSPLIVPRCHSGPRVALMSWSSPSRYRR